MNTNTIKKEKPVPRTMDAAREFLDAQDIPYEEKTPYHLKMGAVNFYPTTGKITIDSAPSYPEKGLKALLAVLDLQEGWTQATKRGGA